MIKEQANWVRKKHNLPIIYEMPECLAASYTYCVGVDPIESDGDLIASFANCVICNSKVERTLKDKIYESIKNFSEKLFGKDCYIYKPRIK